MYCPAKPKGEACLRTPKLDDVMRFRGEPGPPGTVGLSAPAHSVVRGLESARGVAQNSPGALGDYWPSKRVTEPLEAILFLSEVLLDAVSLSTE